jgi:glutamate 5-kinase
VSQIPDISTMRRIVVKIGSALIADIDHARVHSEWLRGLCEDIGVLKRQGCEVVVVSSGAVALGRPVLGLGHKALELIEKQAAAACGQIQLMQAWQHALAPEHCHAAQVLLTLDDSEHRKRYLNARATFETLLARGLVPVVNENDTVTTAEIRFGDNDRLAARVAGMISADACILLSDIDGLYTANPKITPDAEHVCVIHAITPAIEAMAGGAVSATSSGGMITKILAAKMALDAGCHLAITRGNIAHPLQALIDGGRASWFLASVTPMSARKHWIAGAMSERGAVIIDDGAARALVGGASLLPSGVTAVEGAFERGDTVLIKTHAGQVIGKGITAYDAAEAVRILGVRSEAIAGILGYHVRDTLIHRDDLVLL